MKFQELLCYIILIGLLIFFIGERKKDEPKINVLHEAENIAVPEDYRKIIGYDSVEAVFFMGKWEVNFCYPNQWEFEKFKLDTTKK